MDKQKKLLIIPCVSGMISAFLPWVTVPILGSLSGTSDKTGWIIFALFGTALVICLGGDHKDALTGKYKAGIISTIALASIIGIVEIIDLKNITPLGKERDIFGEVIANTFEIGIGLYLEVLSGVISLIIALIPFKNSSNITD